MTITQGAGRLKFSAWRVRWSGQTLYRPRETGRLKKAPLRAAEVPREEMQRTMKYAEIVAMRIVDGSNGPEIQTVQDWVIAPNAETAKKVYLKENPDKRIKEVMMFQSLFVMPDNDFFRMASEHDRHACDANGKVLDVI